MKPAKTPRPWKKHVPGCASCRCEDCIERRAQWRRTKRILMQPFPTPEKEGSYS